MVVNREPQSAAVENPVNAGFELALDRFLMPLIEDPSKIESIGDLGCGYFFEAPVLRQNFPTARIVGVDFNSAALERAKLANVEVEGIEYQEADLEKDNLLTGEPFDLIVFRRPGPTNSESWQNIRRKSFMRLKDRGLILATFTDKISHEDFCQILQDFSLVKIVKTEEERKDMPSPWVTNEPFAVACEIRRGYKK